MTLEEMNEALGFMEDILTEAMDWERESGNMGMDAGPGSDEEDMGGLVAGGRGYETQMPYSATAAAAAAAAATATASGSNSVAMAVAEKHRSTAVNLIEDQKENTCNTNTNVANMGGSTCSSPPSAVEMGVVKPTRPFVDLSKYQPIAL
jgi:hypothetical protein